MNASCHLNSINDYLVNYNNNIQDIEEALFEKYKDNIMDEEYAKLKNELKISEDNLYQKRCFDGLDVALSGHHVWEGHCYQIPEQISKLKNLIDEINPLNILEIGFGAGHSSLLFLLNSTANVVSFDLCVSSYAGPAKNYIDELFPGRHTLIKGDSAISIPEYVENNPGMFFNLVFIDGGNKDNAPLIDCVNCMHLVHENHIVILDDTAHDSSLSQHWTIQPTYFWNRLKSKEVIYEYGYSDYSLGRGMSWGRYNLLKNKKDVMNILYKSMNKTDLFNNIKYLYDNKSEERLKHVSDLYLSFFNDLDDYQVRKVKYYSSVSKINSNMKSAILSLEDLLRDKKLENDIKEDVFSSLKSLYQPNKEEIPKIIHLLYFGETPFHNYHFRCVNSMLKYMPDYKINIYNTKEPISNEYWNSIKKNKNVEIKHIVVPEFFDDYKLTSFQYKADVVRLELLYEYGGIYLDLDMLIVNNFEEVFNNGKDLYICKETATENSGLINAFLACKPKNEFLKIWLDNFKTGLRMNIWAYHIRDTNKMLIENNPHYLLKYNIDILGNHTFFPVSWTDTNAFENKNPVLFDSNTYGVHLFETILHHILIRNEFFRMPDEFEGDMLLDKNVSVENEPLKDPITLTIENTKAEPLINVDEIVVLTLKERPEKIDYMVEHLTLNNLDHTLIVNNLHENPSIGCMESHIGAIKYAKEKGLKSIFIFEDDVLIRENFNLEEQLKTTPENWDMLYFGGILTSAREKSNNWIKGIVWCNHAYIVKDTMYDIILDKYAEINVEEMGKRKETIDHFYTKEILPYYNCWLNENQPIIQKEGYSDLSKKVKWGNNFNWSTFSMKNLCDL